MELSEDKLVLKLLLQRVLQLLLKLMVHPPGYLTELLTNAGFSLVPTPPLE